MSDTSITIEFEKDFWVSEILEDVDDDILIAEVIERGLDIYTEADSAESRLSKAMDLRERLCDQFNLPRGATSKEQLIDHINSLL